jgi:hypothetical protein
VSPEDPAAATTVPSGTAKNQGSGHLPAAEVRPSDVTDDEEEKGEEESWTSGSQPSEAVYRPQDHGDLSHLQPTGSVLMPATEEPVTSPLPDTGKEGRGQMNKEKSGGVEDTLVAAQGQQLHCSTEEEGGQAAHHQPGRGLKRQASPTANNKDLNGPWRPGTGTASSGSVRITEDEEAKLNGRLPLFSGRCASVPVTRMLCPLGPGYPDVIRPPSTVSSGGELMSMMWSAPSSSQPTAACWSSGGPASVQPSTPVRQVVFYVLQFIFWDENQTSPTPTMQ